MSTGDMPR